MSKIILLSLILFSFSSCRKDATKVYPELVGYWSRHDPFCYDQPVLSSYLIVGSDNIGTFSTGGYDDETFEGKVKVRKNKLFVKGEYVGDIIYVNDDVDYIYNDTTNGICTMDSIKIKGTLRIKLSDTKHESMFYR